MTITITLTPLILMCGVLPFVILWYLVAKFWLIGWAKDKFGHLVKTQTHFALFTLALAIPAFPMLVLFVVGSMLEYVGKIGTFMRDKMGT